MTDLAPKYNPNEVEKGRYQEWLDEDLLSHLAIKKLTLIQLLFHHQM